MCVCAAPTCSHQSFDGSSYYVDVDVDVKDILKSKETGQIRPRTTLPYSIPAPRHVGPILIIGEF